MPCSNQFINFVPGCATNLIVGNFPKKIFKAKFTYPSGFVLIVGNLEPSSEGGTITIPNNGYWHNGSGDVMLEFYQGNDCEPHLFEHCGREYSSILLSFINETITPAEEEHVVFCDCEDDEDEDDGHGGGHGGDGDGDGDDDDGRPLIED